MPRPTRPYKSADETVVDRISERLKRSLSAESLFDDGGISTDEDSENEEGEASTGEGFGHATKISQVAPQHKASLEYLNRKLSEWKMTYKRGYWAARRRGGREGKLRAIERVSTRGGHADEQEGRESGEWKSVWISAVRLWDLYSDRLCRENTDLKSTLRAPSTQQIIHEVQSRYKKPKVVGRGTSWDLSAGLGQGMSARSGMSAKTGGSAGIMRSGPDPLSWNAGADEDDGDEVGEDLLLLARARTRSIQRRRTPAYTTDGASSDSSTSSA